MAPKKAGGNTPASYMPNVPVDPEHEKRIKAEARAYALSGSSSAAKRKSPSTVQASGPIRKVSRQSNSNIPAISSTVNPQRTEAIQNYGSATKPKVQVPTTGPPRVTTFEGDEDYVQFVKSLNLDDPMFAAVDNDDEEFHLSDVDDDDDEDDEGDLSAMDSTGLSSAAEAATSTPTLSSPLTSSPVQLPNFEASVYRDLEEELGSLLEEDLQAAVQSLMTSKTPNTSSAITPSSPSSKGPEASNQPQAAKATPDTRSDSPATPLRDAARQGSRAQVTYLQAQQLRHLLTRHYQLLVQQAILGIRAAHVQKLNKEKSDFLSGETADDLAEILDGAVGMLQDLDQNRKDAIRTSMQLADSVGDSDDSTVSLPGRRSLLSKFAETSNSSHQKQKDRPLTRLAFSQSLRQGGNVPRRTTFDIPGLVKLKETFSTIDRSVAGLKKPGSILELPTHGEACRIVLRQAGANIVEILVPGERKISDNFCDCGEFFGESFKEPCTEEQDVFLRRNRNLFTSSEDNLVLRGVNLYGEKQWILIADRYLPDRSVNIISQRYSKLCVMLYKAHGIAIDEKGCLHEPPKLESVDDIDEEKVNDLGLTTVVPPAILNVHRWSLEEDLTLLKAVPLMGHMWAELGARLIPHRDRGHLRKRYQVLERRVKATVARNSKSEGISSKLSKGQGAMRKLVTPALSLRPPLTKTGGKAGNKVAATKSSVQLKAPRMSIEKAAASLAFLRPAKAESVSLSAVRTNPSVQSAEVAKQDTGASISAAHLLKPHTDTSRKAAAAGTSKPAPVAHAPTYKHPYTKLSTHSSKLSFMDEPSASRLAFEQLVDGTGEEWSQMSRVKKMLENDPASHTDDAIVSSLVKSPMRSNLSKLPQMELDSDSMSGLSILQSEASRQHDTEHERPPKVARASIMSRVLGSSSKSEEWPRSHPKETVSRTAGSKADPDKETPKKKQARQIPNPATPLPSTPKRPNFFSMTGTPIGLSPGFRPSPNYALNSIKSKSIRATGPLSPPPSSVSRLVNDQSVDGFRYCDFNISEESQQRFEGASRDQRANDPPSTPSKSTAFGEHLMANDLDAISALSALSNSPFKKGLERRDMKRKEAKQSFFATVVGGTKKKTERQGLYPKHKLDF